VRSEQYRLRHDLGDERAVHACRSVYGRAASPNQEIWMAETKKDALLAFDAFAL
jgi:hypothetical protein